MSDYLERLERRVKALEDMVRRLSAESIGLAYSAKVASNVTTTSTSASNVTGLSFAVAAGEVWVCEINLNVGCDNTGGIKFAITVPASTTFLATLHGTGNTSGSIQSDTLSASGTLTTNAFERQATSDGFMCIKSTYTISATAGTVQLQFASATGGQTSTVFADSYLVARRMS